MSSFSKTTVERPFYLYSISIFLIIISPNLFSKGMFMDGLIYATISKNMAHDLGSFWAPYNAAIFLPDFNGHPPLAFGMESIFFKIFGDGLWVEKLYSAFTFLIVGILIVRIWKHFFNENGWLPLFFWFMIPSVQWACSNNILENTLEIWTTFSIYLYLRGVQKKRHILFLSLAGFSLFLGFLSKGPVAFFPWTFPFLYYLLRKPSNWIRGIFESVILCVATLLPLAILLLVSTPARKYLFQYFDEQILNSLLHVATVDSRWHIVNALLSDMILPLAIAAIVLFCLVKKLGLSFKYLKKLNRNVQLFLAFALTGVLPIMVSLKQSSMYLLASLPFFAIMIAASLHKYVTIFLSKIDILSRNFSRFRIISYCFMALACMLTFAFSFTYNRDQDKIQDIKAALTIIPSGSIINVAPKLDDDYNLHEYFARLKSVSTDEDLRNTRRYLFLEHSLFHDSILKTYTLVPIVSNKYKLFVKKEPN